MKCYVRTVTVLLVCAISHVQLFATPWTGTHQAPLPMGFSSQEYQNGLPFPSPEDRPNPGIEPTSPALQAYSLSTELPPKYCIIINPCLCTSYMGTWLRSPCSDFLKTEDETQSWGPRRFSKSVSRSPGYYLISKYWMRLPWYVVMVKRTGDNFCHSAC